MTWTSLQKYYPFIKNIIISGLIGGACGYAALGIGRLLGFEATNQAVLLMIGWPLFIVLSSYRTHGKTCVQKDPAIPSLLLAGISTLLLVTINSALSINASENAIAALAFSMYFINVICIPIKYPQYRVKNTYPTISEKLKDMHG